MARTETSGQALNRIKQLQDEISSLQADARDQLLGRIRKDVAELNTMGVTYQLVATRTGRQGPRQRISDPSKPCPVCRFRTEPYHDARSHRGQGKSKKPFSADELKSHGLVRR